ncbi:MAG: oligopeptidase B [Gammaproteobacteria bacterium]|jgi:oligopeptidase B
MRPPCLLILILALSPACQSRDDSQDRSAADMSSTPSTVAAPRARIAPHELEIHGDVRVDNYFWMNQRESPEVIAHLEAENAYMRSMMAQTETLQDELFHEIKGRIKQDDESVPYSYDGYYYYTRYEVGQEYPIHCRKRSTLEDAEQVLLNVNELAVGQPYCSVRAREISTNGNLMAYAIDNVGRRFYTLHVKDLSTGQVLDEVIPSTTGNVAWANDNATLFYTKQDPETLRSYQIWRHTIGTDTATDTLIFEEEDDTFSCYVNKTKSKRFMVISSDQTLSSEARYLDANNPNGDFKVFLPRARDHEYELDHFGGHFYVRTNDGAQNFRLMRTAIDNTQRGAWEEVVEHRDDVLLEGFEVLAGHLILDERKNGLGQLRYRRWSETQWHTIDFKEPAYSIRLTRNVDFDTAQLRYGYSSMRTPGSVYEYDLESGEPRLLKRDEVLGGFNRENYVTERLLATARDGTQVPISLVYRTDVERDGSNPLLLYAYGSYGSSSDASFSSSRISLLDRGFIAATAHVRGGSEMGRAWYEGGKLHEKKNTFTDFIDCAEHLVEAGYTSPSSLYGYGGSAGGLLIGAVANMRPDLFDGLIAAVPFVDVVTTMLDDTIPLTTSEYDEWGNPNEEGYYRYMLSYSPYDQVVAQAYPSMLVTTGLHDSQVQYFEPAKWVAKLRALKTDNNRLVIKIDMKAGHGGASGRDHRIKDTAFNYAFLIDLARSRAR